MICDSLCDYFLTIKVTIISTVHRLTLNNGVNTFKILTRDSWIPEEVKTDVEKGDHLTIY